MQKKDKFTIAMTMIGATLNLCYIFKTNLLFVTVALLIFHSKKLHLMFEKMAKKQMQGNERNF